MSYTLLCAILGKETPFAIQADGNELVYELKRRICAEEHQTLASFQASNLILYKVNIEVSSEETFNMAMEAISQGSIDVHDRLNYSFSPVSGYFDLPNLPARTIHILVERPTATIPTTPPTNRPPRLSLKHTPTKPSNEINDAIKVFLNEHLPGMRNLVAKADDIPSLLPSWKPRWPCDEKFAKHINKLDIPAGSRGEPSLLLHALGEEKDSLDRDRIARIPDVFSWVKHTILINTSGSGKTHLLLDGLCHRWGFYFVAKPDMTGIGSDDLWEVLTGRDHAESYGSAREMMDESQTPKATQRAIEHIREVTRRHLAQVLLARILVLRLLLQEAQSSSEGLQEKKHRRLWVLLQVQPHIISQQEGPDIFSALTKILQGASGGYLKEEIHSRSEELLNSLPKTRNPVTGHNQAPPFSCVVDEVQITVSPLYGRLGQFMSDDRKTDRFILREIWLSWTEALPSNDMNLVLSGTGIEYLSLISTVSSDAFKLAPYQIVNDIGAFDDHESQARYIQRYVPENFDPHWVEFFTRTWAWLHGRYRSTATLISLLLEGGYRCPHRTIDLYIQEYTGFQPTDGKDWTDSEPQFLPNPTVQLLDFDRMDASQAGTLCTAIYDQVLHGRYTLSSFSNEEKATFIKYGFARRRGPETIIDEPLAILAAVRWLDKTKEFSMFNYLHQNIHKYAPRQNGFETYLAFYLRKVFEIGQPLDTVFTFRDDFALRTDLSWQHEEFELVTVVATANRNQPQVSVITPYSGPSSNIGLSATSGAEVLEWISTNYRQSAFCFPPNSFGPDLLCFVRSRRSGKLLLVVIQSKYYREVEKQDLIHGVRTVTPSWFWRSKDKKYATAGNARFIHKSESALAKGTKRALANIPSGLHVKRADYSVLRVFASFPGEAGLNRTNEWDSSRDTDGHPLATLHYANFKKVGEKLDQNWFRGHVEQELVVQLKRAREEEQSSIASRAGKRRHT